MLLTFMCLALAMVAGVVLANGHVAAAVLGFAFSVLFGLAVVAKKENAHR